MYLVYFAWSEAGAPKSATVKLDTTKKIGRRSSCDIVVADNQVSNEQAEVFEQGGVVKLKNISKTNDILVGESVVAKNGGTTMLTNGASLKMGTTPFLVSISTVSSTSTTFKDCTWCGKAIPADATNCNWCGNDQGAGTDATYTMA